MINSPWFSIVIPTYNSYIEKNCSLYYTVKSILMQNFMDYELIIVDTGCSDNSIIDIKTLDEKIKVIDCGKTESVGYARNLGAKNSRGTFILFVDDDTLLTKVDTLSKIHNISENFDFMCGANRYWSSIYWYKQISKKQSIISSINTLLDISFLPKGINRDVGFRDLNEYTFIGNFGVIRKKLFEEIHGFDELFKGWGLEDTDLMMRLCLTDSKYTLLTKYDISVIHLTHISDNSKSHSNNQSLFNEKEIKNGMYFHINHFFGVYEADGTSLFTEI